MYYVIYYVIYHLAEQSSGNHDVSITLSSVYRTTAALPMNVLLYCTSEYTVYWRVDLKQQNSDPYH